MAGSRDTSRHHASEGLTAFGLGLLTELAPPGAWRRRPLVEPVVELRMASPDAIPRRWSGAEELGWRGTIDGAPFVVERGRAGDHRFVHGAPPEPDSAPWRPDGMPPDPKGTPPDPEGAPPDPEGAPRRPDDTPTTRAVHHLSPDAAVLSCAPSDPGDRWWWRELLDSTLFSVALLRGYEALHAGAIATPLGAIAIAAPSGGGKSTLLSELLAHGAELLADDVLVLEWRGSGRPPLAHPAPPVMTVPAARLPRLRETLAPSTTTIATVAGEHWIAVPVHPEPLPLAGVVTLNRTPGAAPAARGEDGPCATMSRDERPLAALLGALMRFPRTAERERTRFELAAAIAGGVPVWRLDADPGVAPEALAELLLAEVTGDVASPPPAPAVAQAPPPAPPPAEREPRPALAHSTGR